MVLASSKLYGNDELHIPKVVKNGFKSFEIDSDTIFDWDIRDDEIILIPRRKVNLDDVIGMIDDDEDWDVDELIYNV